MGDKLPTKREPSNSEDKGAVAVIEANKIVGYMPGTIAKYCSTFIERNGKIVCEITGQPRDQQISMNTGGEEVPCIYHFSADDENNLQKIKDVLKGLDTPLAQLVDSSADM